MIAAKLRHGIVALCLSMVVALPAWSAFTAPQNLDPSSAGVRLDSSFQSDAWLVYSYDIDEQGRVVDTTIHISNGVLEVEQAVLQQIGSQRFSPAQSNGRPVKYSAAPVVYTWILDKPRELSPRFKELYQLAWAHYAEGDYGAASDIAAQLQAYPGRNALEEVKSRILRASLASRRQDEAAELQHLGRVVDFQQLALSNNFRNVYLPTDQYLKVLKRVMVLQLNRNMLADAGLTLQSIQALGPGSDTSREAVADYREAETAFRSIGNLRVDGELEPLYPGGPASWETGLARERFSLGEVRGQVNSVYLVCASAEKRLPYPARDPWSIPPGWTACLIEVTGEAGTRMVLNQYASGG